MTAKPKRGGAREGAGRKAVDGTVGKPRLVQLDEATVLTLQKLGEGNLSLGIRRAALSVKAKA